MMFKVRNSMVIQSQQGITNSYFMCSNLRGCIDALEDAIITHYYSVRHAKDDGWLFTDDKMFHDPTKKERGSWVCPECVKSARGESNED